jgi:hypothetical protein
MKVKALIWLGVRTLQFNAMTHLYKDVMQLDVFEENDASSRFTLQNGSEVHVYHHEDKDHDFFGVGPVVGFLVDDVVKAKAEMEGAGIDFIGPIQHSETHSWNHFRSPDGNIYEIMDQK